MFTVCEPFKAESLVFFFLSIDCENTWRSNGDTSVET